MVTRNFSFNTETRLNENSIEGLSGGIPQYTLNCLCRQLVPV